MENEIIAYIDPLEEYIERELNYFLSIYSLDNLKEDISEEDKELCEDVYNQLLRLNNTAKDVCFEVLEKCRVSGDSVQNLKFITNIISSLLSGIPITQLTGEDNEWEDISDDPELAEIIGKDILLTYKDSNYGFNVESIQRNWRYRSAFRFNNDNNLAHISNVISFEDNEGNITNNTRSARYITFPFNVTDQHYIIPKEEELGCNQAEYVDNMGDTFIGYPLPYNLLQEYLEEKKKPHHLSDDEDNTVDGNEEDSITS
jgi:hypothetical protein